MKKLEIAGLVIAGALFAVWPIQRTISLRDLLLVLSIGMFTYLAVRARPSRWWFHIEWPVGLYLILTLWMIVVAVFISEETAWSLGEIQGQWLRGMLALLTGGLVAFTVRQNPTAQRTAVTIVLAVLLLHIVYVDYLGLKMLLETGRIIRGYASGLTQGTDASNYLTNMLLVLLLAETFIRLAYGQRYLPLPNAALLTIILLTLFSVYAEGLRNGIVEIACVLLVFAVLFVLENRRRVGKTVIVFIISLTLVVPGVFAYLSHGTDSRWATFLETVPLALDTDTHTQWINIKRQHELKLSSGEAVDWSNYMRLARMKAGVDLTLENPWGVGFGRNAFGHAVMKKYGESSSHSHSGLIDLAVGTGIPGTLLWLGFLASLATLAWRSFRRTRDYCALALLLLVTGYSTRMVLDSIVRDHMLQMFLFLAAFLAVIAAGQLARQQASTAAPPG